MEEIDNTIRSKIGVLKMQLSHPATSEAMRDWQLKTAKDVYGEVVHSLEKKQEKYLLPETEQFENAAIIREAIKALRKLCVRLGDAYAVEEVSKEFSKEFREIVADCYAKLGQPTQLS